MKRIILMLVTVTWIAEWSELITCIDPYSGQPLKQDSRTVYFCTEFKHREMKKTFNTRFDADLFMDGCKELNTVTCRHWKVIE